MPHIGNRLERTENRCRRKPESPPRPRARPRETSPPFPRSRPRPLSSRLPSATPSSGRHRRCRPSSPRRRCRPPATRNSSQRKPRPQGNTKSSRRKKPSREDGLRKPFPRNDLCQEPPEKTNLLSSDEVSKVLTGISSSFLRFSPVVRKRTSRAASAATAPRGPHRRFRPKPARSLRRPSSP